MKNKNYKVGGVSEKIPIISDGIYIGYSQKIMPLRISYQHCFKKQLRIISNCIIKNRKPTPIYFAVKFDENGIANDVWDMI